MAENDVVSQAPVAGHVKLGWPVLTLRPAGARAGRGPRRAESHYITNSQVANCLLSYFLQTMLRTDHSPLPPRPRPGGPRSSCGNWTPTKSPSCCSPSGSSPRPSTLYAAWTTTGATSGTGAATTTRSWRRRRRKR